MESLSIWSLAGVVLNSAVIMAVRLSTRRVWHTFNYDVTVSNGVNLCHPVLPVLRRLDVVYGIFDIYILPGRDLKLTFLSATID